MQKRSTKRMSFGLAMALCCLYMADNAYAENGGAKSVAALHQTESTRIVSAERQAVTLTGKVVNENGMALPGVTVVLKGTTTGTTTNEKGEFSLTVPNREGTLVFSFIGYTTQEVPASSRSFNISLRPDTKALEEVVVIGYGTQRKSDVTGAVTAVTSDDFVKGQVTTPEQLIQGKVAGVQITSNSGAPGAGSRIRIRGGASLFASNDPLIVIDGVPVDNTGTAGSANPLNFLNPNDIESFNILKDASATAIYGSRASNGVIIITTKKGKAGDKFNLNFSTMGSVSKVNNTIEVLNAEEYRALVNRVRPNQANLLGNANTNWQDLIYRSAYTTDNNLSLSGSYKSLPYRLSLGYLNQEGVLKTSEFERQSIGLSLSPSFLDDHLKVNLNFKGARTDSRFANEGAIGAAVVFDPTQPVFADNRFGGYYQWTKNGNFNTLAPTNPLSLLEQIDNRGEVKRGIANIQLDYKFHFLPELRANLNLGIDKSESDGRVITPGNFAPNTLGKTTISQYAQNKENELVEFYLNYVKELDALNSRIDFMAGYSFQDFYTKSPDFNTVDEQGKLVAEPLDGIPAVTHNRLRSFFGRATYSLKDRYILTATVRRDGSSRFSEDNRWGTFPALAFAWRVNEEEFMKNSSTISDLKLRLGYGITGQQDINSLFPYLPRYTFGDNTAQYQFGNQFITTLRPEGYDADIKWEETTTYNAGIDFGLWSNRVSGSLDYYFKDTKDLLAEINVPAGSNLTNRLFTNVGNMETKGLEAALNFVAISNNKLTWNIGINGTVQDIKITNLSKVEDPGFEGYDVGGIAGGVGNTIQKFRTGFSPFAFFVYKQVYGENGKPIEGLYADLNGDGVIDQNDKYLYKSPNADFFMGFNSQLTYGKWDFGFVMRGSYGNYMYNNVYSDKGAYQAFSFPDYLTNVSRNALETEFSNFQLFSDYYIENASFLRMDNINLGYNVGRVFNDKVGLRVNANVQNAFIITNYNGLDPEIASGIDNTLYPRPRVFTLGLNVDL